MNGSYLRGVDAVGFELSAGDIGWGEWRKLVVISSKIAGETYPLEVVPRKVFCIAVTAQLQRQHDVFQRRQRWQ